MEKGNALIVGAPYDLWRDTIDYFERKGYNFIVFGWKSDADLWKSHSVTFFAIEHMWRLSFDSRVTSKSYLDWRIKNPDKFLELIAMIDRLESNLVQLPHQLKENLIYNSLSFIDSLVDGHNIDYVIMTNIPHRIWDNCIYHVAESRGLKMTIFALTQFGSNVMVYDSIDGSPRLHCGLYCTNVSILQELESKWREISNEYLPRDMVIQAVENKSFLKYICKKYIGKLGRLTLNRWRELVVPNTYRILRTRSLTATNPSWLLFILDSLMKYFKIKKLRKSYSLLSVDNLPEQYVYFPLHYQPEETTLPSGLGYYNQLELIRSLSKFLPPNLWLVVKEHPSQFYHSNEGDRGRYLGFYQDVLSCTERVVLASMELSSVDIMKNSAAVVTVNGTVGLEALYARKRVLTFGRVWYSGLKGVRHIRETDIERFFKSIEVEPEGGMVESIEWTKFLLSVKVYKEHQNMDDISVKESSMNLISYIENVIFN